MAQKKPVKSDQLTCFVVTGFGRKTDYSTGRVLNLDKTYEQLVRPAFDQVNVNAFRAIDANLTGSIDTIMYQWLYHADFVIADLSTLNANVFYELGVRHAQTPNTTVIIAESVLMTKIPFDLSSFVLHQYFHDGDEISEAEQKRFVPHLAGVLKDIIETEERRRESEAKAAAISDSPIYTFLQGMKPPEYKLHQHLEAPAFVPPDQRAKKVEEVDEGAPLASLIEAAEDAKRHKDFEKSIQLFQTAIDRELEEGKKPDISFVQRLALVTYKHGERKGDNGEVDKEVAKAALFEAEQILETHCAPNISTDPETLGLSGAINKRLFDHTGDLEYLERAIRFYERGFYVKQDYYNGINVAFMYTTRANLLESTFDAIVSYGHGNMIRKKVAEICEGIMADTETYQTRGDKQWLLLTLAEAYLGMGRDKDAERLWPKIEAEATEFGLDAYQSQKTKLVEAMAEFRRRVPADLGGGTGDTSQASDAATKGAEASAIPEAATAPEASAMPGASGASGASVVPRAPAGMTTGGAGGRSPISIAPELLEGKPLRSIEVRCKIEYNDETS